MGNRVELVAADGHTLSAWHASPVGVPRAGMVIVQEAFGLSAYIRSVVDHYAEQGYVALAPALYDRQMRGVALDGHSPEVLAQGRALRAGLVWSLVLADISAAIDAVRCGGGVGIVGFCVGGSVAWMAAQSLPVDAAVAYYGRDIVEHLEPAPACPVMLHFGEQDPLIPLADVDRVLSYLGARPIGCDYRQQGARAADAAGYAIAIALLRSALDHRVDPALLEASNSLGASSWMTFRRVTLPLIAPGLGSGAFLAFMASFDNVPVSLFLADERTEVLPIHLWQQIDTNLDVRTAAASGVIVIFTLVLMLIAERFAGITQQMR